MRVIFTCLLYLSLITFSNAQLLDLSTSYRANWQIINPAATNELHMLDKFKRSILNVSGRSQAWGQGFAGAPKSSSFRYENYPDFDVSNTRIKWGILGTAAKAGALNTYRLQGNIAAILPISDDGKTTISVGANIGSMGNQIRICTGMETEKNPDCIRFKSGQTSYANLQETPFSLPFLDVAVGVFYRQVLRDLYCTICDGMLIDEFYIGLSVPQISTPINFDSSAADSSLFIRPQYNISLLAGAFFPVFKNSALSKRTFIEASIWVRHDPLVTYISPFLEAEERLPISTDVNIRYVHSSTFWAGVGYSTQGMGHLETGVYLREGDSNGLFLSNISAAYSMPLAWDNPFRNFMEVNIGFAWK
ncbi:MAG: type IX secretion system membrane protein PorP/SprF [Bacteroidota bacterium]